MLGLLAGCLGDGNPRPPPPKEFRPAQHAPGEVAGRGRAGMSLNRPAPPAARRG